MKYTFDYENKGDLGQAKAHILLSKSPRRRDLLNFLDPQIQDVDIDERKIQDKFMDLYKDDDFVTRVAKTCCEISKGKANLQMDPDKIYIAADTMVICDETIYNKPVDRAEAEAMIRSYFGKTHHVVTSVCLKSLSGLDVFYTVAEVEFVDYYKELEPAIQAYLETGSQMDKSGAYGIQDLDPRFVKRISGDIHTIIGLPVAETARRLFAR